jgi:protein TonB
MKLKNLLLVACLMYFFNVAHATSNTTVSDTIDPIMLEDSIFDVVEEMPFFSNNCEGSYEIRQQCGNKKMLEFLYKNIKYPIIARENGVVGKVVIFFIIEKDGSISNIEMIRNPGAGVGEEVIRVINLMPTWEAGKHHGKPVQVRIYLPVTINIK